MDVSLLLDPRTDESVSGENLEYDPLFTDLELAAQPGEERQEGDKIIPAEDPDWKSVESKAADVLAVSHDLRAAVFYAQAVLHTSGISGFAEIVDYIHGCLEQHWETCHPQLDEDDGDPTMRINAIQGLGGSDQVVKSLRRAALTESRMFGNLSLRDMEVADGTIVASNEEDHVDSSAIGAAFQDTDPDFLTATLASAISIREKIQAIDAIFVENTPGQGPSLELLSSTLSGIIKRVSDVVGGGEELVEAGSDGSVEGTQGGGGAVAAPSGAINSPSDVTVALDKIISYYARAEPSSPVPILLERAKLLIGADFMTIMNNLAPRGVEEVNVIRGHEDD